MSDNGNNEFSPKSEKKTKKKTRKRSPTVNHFSGNIPTKRRKYNDLNDINLIKKEIVTLESGSLSSNNEDFTTFDNKKLKGSKNTSAFANGKRLKKRQGPQKPVKKARGGCSSACKDDVSSLKGNDEKEAIKISDVNPGSTCAKSSKLPFELKWDEDELLAEIQNLERTVARNIVKLFEDENTIPFIARYRKDMTNGMDADKLRKVKESYQYIKHVRQKAESLLKKISSLGKLDDSVTSGICNARSLVELESIGAVFKSGNKKTLAERAKLLGLEEPAKKIFYGTEEINPKSLIRSEVEGLETLEKVTRGLQHIIAELISKDQDVLAALKKMQTAHDIKLESKGKKIDDDPALKEKFSKYLDYIDFQKHVKYVQPHQILAINRGESQKFLSVKINVSDSLWDSLKRNCTAKWLSKGIDSPFRRQIIAESLNDAIHRLLSPTLVRQIRAQLNENAENESINVFVANLRQLLMTRPLRGKVVMAIDPGFKNGCKVALVDQHGTVQHVDKFFLPQMSKSSSSNSVKLRELLNTFCCETIALGNGKGCREAEAFLKDLISQEYFKPLNVRYTIVNEQGVSIYSCSAIAQEEFPGLDPNFISAASLARRLQDPLNELVKVEPKHLGVGMYQHDVSEKKLIAALDEVVSECVSFVGVDANSASIYLLKRVAGLNEAKAKSLVEWRLSHGSFRTREDLKNVKGIGPKTFVQCAGFIRIIPSTAENTDFSCNKKGQESASQLNPLDRTWIHPESYEVAKSLINQLGLKLSDLGTPHFTQTVAERLKSLDVETLSSALETSEVAMQLIVDALSVSPDHDLRNLESAPLFRDGFTSLSDLKVGDQLTGVVRNVVHFGAFVDIGVGIDGLIHKSSLKNKTVKLNDKVLVAVANLELARKRIGLQLISIG